MSNNNGFDQLNLSSLVKIEDLPLISVIIPCKNGGIQRNN